MEFKGSVGGKNISNNDRNVNGIDPSKIVCKDLCDRRDLKLKEAEKTIANKDVIIKMLQEHVKKLEESYKHNLKASEDFRYKYCLASEQVKRLRSCPKYCSAPHRRKDEKESKMSNDFVAVNQQPNKLNSTSPTEDCTTRGLSKCTNTLLQSKTLKQFKKVYYEMIQNLVEKIMEQKNLTPKENQTDHGNILATVEDLRYEMGRLKEANEKLQEQLDFHAYQNFSLIKSRILETYQKKNSELKNTVTKLQDLIPDIFKGEGDEDVKISNTSITFESIPQEITLPSEEMTLAKQNPTDSTAKNNENITNTFRSDISGGTHKDEYSVSVDEDNQNEWKNNSISNNVISENMDGILKNDQGSQHGYRNCGKPRCLGKLGTCGCTNIISKEINSSSFSSSEVKKQKSSVVYENQSDNFSKRDGISTTNTVSTNTETTEFENDEITINTNSHRRSASTEQEITRCSSRQKTTNNGCDIISESSDLCKNNTWVDVEKNVNEEMETMDFANDRYNQSQTKIAPVGNQENNAVFTVQDFEDTPAKIEVSSNEDQCDVVTSFGVDVEPCTSKNFTSSRLASTLTEIKVKIVELVQKQDRACKKVEVLRNQMAVVQETTQSCSVQISKLTESVEGQKETFIAKFEENKIITDELKQTNDKIKIKLGELEHKIKILFNNVDELKEKQKVLENIRHSLVSQSDNVITVGEYTHKILGNENNGTEFCKGEQSQDVTFTATETLDFETKTKFSSKMSECSILQEHLSDLQKEKIQKDRQITCLNELICSYSKINNNVSTIYPDMTTQIQRHLKDFQYEDEIQDYIEKIREENHKLKTTISCVIDHLQEKMKELHFKISGENIGTLGDSNMNDWSACNSDPSKTCLNQVPCHQSPQDHPEIQIEDIYNAVLRSIIPFKKCDDSPPYSCKKVNSLTCRNVNIEHLIDGKKSGQEVNIEDVYKAVLHSCNSKEENAQQKLIANVNKIKSKRSVGSSVKSKDDYPSQTTCNCLGHCFMDLGTDCYEGKSIITNLQTYVQYLQEQLQVITNIENQIEDLSTDIKNPYS